MKKLILSVAILLSLGAAAQTTPKQKVNGTEITDQASPKAKPVLTTYTYNHAGQQLPVYKSANGKYFAIITSKKSGKPYRKYLTF